MYSLTKGVSFNLIQTFSTYLPVTTMRSILLVRIFLFRMILLNALTIPSVTTSVPSLLVLLLISSSGLKPPFTASIFQMPLFLMAKIYLQSFNLQERKTNVLTSTLLLLYMVSIYGSVLLVNKKPSSSTTSVKGSSLVLLLACIGICYSIIVILVTLILPIMRSAGTGIIYV